MTIRVKSQVLKPVAAGVALCLWVQFGGAQAAIIVDADGGAGPPPAGHLSPRFPEDADFRYRVVLDPLPAAALAAPNAADLAALAAEFPGWIFVAGGPAPGTFTVQRYDVHIDRDLPHRFQVDYAPGAGGAPGPALNWIQTIDTNAPCKPGLPNPYVDPQCMGPLNMPDDALPFYWTMAEVAGKALPGGGLRFTDRPSRNLAHGLDWEAHLLLSSWNGIGAVGGPIAPTVTYYDGLRWGFEIICVRQGDGDDVATGVAGDKEDSEERGNLTTTIPPPPRCFSDVPEPGTAPTLIVGLLALSAAGAFSTGRRMRRI